MYNRSSRTTEYILKVNTRDITQLGVTECTEYPERSENEICAIRKNEMTKEE
jgi:hypothetical protein